MQDIYRLRKIVQQEEAAQSVSSDSGQPSYEHSKGSPIKEEDEEPTTQLEGASESGSITEVDEGLDVSDEQSDGCADPEVPSPGSPPPGPTVPHLYTEGAAADMEFAASPAVPAASMESAALPFVPATQTTHCTPPVPAPHNVPGSWYMPPPVVVYIPNPPYQMTLYPLYPVYIPQPTR